MPTPLFSPSPLFGKSFVVPFMLSEIPFAHKAFSEGPSGAKMTGCGTRAFLWEKRKSEAHSSLRQGIWLVM